MQPASPIQLPAMCEGRAVHEKIIKTARATQQNKINNNVACVMCRQSHLPIKFASQATYKKSKWKMSNDFNALGKTAVVAEAAMTMTRACNM